MFKLESPYKPTGDQPEAIEALVDGIKAGAQAQVLLGVTGSGKTFTVANVIERLNRPTLIMSHNKTLAAQLYSEMKAFFPHNAVEYFVSYYDYYQPEAYIPFVCNEHSCLRVREFRHRAGRSSQQSDLYRRKGFL